MTTIVSVRADFAALNPATDPLVFWNDDLRGDWFAYRAGTFTTQLAADPLGGLYIPATGGAYVRQGHWFASGISPEWFGAVGDGSTDDSATFQAAIDLIAALFPYGQQINLAPRRYGLAHGLIWRSHINFHGTNATAIWGLGATLLNTQTGTLEPMISCGPGTCGIRFENMCFDGADKNTPAIFGGMGTTGQNFGTYGVQIKNVQFHHCRPAIRGINCFDWIIADSLFNACGNGATGSGAEVASVYTSNCQNFHIRDNFFDLSFGKGIVTDDIETLAYYVTNNHMEVHSGSGFDAVDAVLKASPLIGNFIWNAASIKLRDGGAANAVIGNHIFNPDGHGIEVHGDSDVVALNTSWNNEPSVDHYLAGSTSNGARFFGNAPTGNMLSASGVTDQGANNQIIGRALRKTTNLDFPSVAAGGTSNMTVTVTGARVGDDVTVTTAPSGSLLYQAWVSANDTVKVRATNPTGSAINPASASFSVRIEG